MLVRRPPSLHPSLPLTETAAPAPTEGVVSTRVPSALVAVDALGATKTSSRAALARTTHVASPHDTGVLARLGRPVAAALLGATLVALPAYGAPLDAGAPPAKVETSVTAMYTGDTNTTKGKTDAYGDLKRPTLAVRHGSWVVATEAAMITPERGVGKRQLDTGLANVTVGYETEHAGAYATVGQLNGVASDAMYAVIDASHHAHGMGDARKSPPSRDAGIHGGVSGRLDQDLTLADLGPGALKLELAAHGTLSTLKQSVGGAALLALESDGARFRPNLPDVPAQAIRGTVAYAGLATEAVLNDVVTDGLGTEHLRASAVAGLSLGLGDHTSVGVEYRRPLLPEVTGNPAAPISTLSLIFSHSF